MINKTKTKACSLLLILLLLAFPACKKSVLKRCQTIVDSRDGKSYKVVLIEDQCWMAESLRYIPTSTTYCYDDKQVNCDTCGVMYHYDSPDDICPKGWHVPTKDEYIQLITNLGGAIPSLEKLKPGGSSGFNALYCGNYEELTSTFKSIKNQGYYTAKGGHLWLNNNVNYSRFLDNWQLFAPCRCLLDD